MESRRQEERERERNDRKKRVRKRLIHKERKRGKEINFQGLGLEEGKGVGGGEKGVMAWIAAKEASGRWGCSKKRNESV